MEVSTESDAEQKNAIYDIKHLPKTKSIQKNLHCCERCHFIQPNREIAKENRDDECPNCNGKDIYKLSYNAPIITIINAEKSFLGRIILSKTGLKTLLPGMYALYVVYDQMDERDD